MIYFRLLAIICPTISIMALYLVNKKLHYKSRLIEWFGSKARYQITLFVLTFFPSLVLILLFDFKYYSPLLTTIQFSFYYLMHLPQDNH